MTVLGPATISTALPTTLKSILSGSKVREKETASQSPNLHLDSLTGKSKKMRLRPDPRTLAQLRLQSVVA